MASLVLGRFTVLGETQHHPTGQSGGEGGGGGKGCVQACVRVCFCKTDEGHILNLSAAEKEGFTIFAGQLLTES